MFFSCTTFRRSATTSATPLIPKCTTRRWTLRRSNYSVAKRQQFSCDLSTATLSLKFENVVVVRFDFSRSIPRYDFYCFTSTYEYESWLFVFVFSGSCCQETSMWYHRTRNVVFFRFLGHSTQTDCRSCSVHPKMHHPAKRSLAMFEHTEEVLRDFIVVIHRDICREHSPIGRRNCLMTEAANSLSAAAGPELSTTRNPIANLASHSATAGLAWVL